MTNSNSPTMHPRYDVLTFGETMLRLTPPDLKRLEGSSTLEVFVGGSESNVAVGLARLGLRVAWLSRLTDNPLGYTIVNALRAHHVDTSHVIWTHENRVGLYFLEEGKQPRGSRVWYDRANSAFSRIKPDDLPHELFSPDQARVFHLSGITLALSSDAAKTALYAAEKAKAAGWLLSFDPNYRANLWSVEAARKGYEPLMALSDLIFLPLRDANLLYDTPDEPSLALLELHKRYLDKTIVLTLGPSGAAAISATGKLYHRPGIEAQEVGRVGGGDSFVAGFLYMYLQTNDLIQALTWGNAAAAFKYTIPGDMPLFNRSELEEMIQAGGKRNLSR